MSDSTRTCRPVSKACSAYMSDSTRTSRPVSKACSAYMSDSTRTSRPVSEACSASCLEDQERRRIISVNADQFQEQFLQCQMCVQKYNKTDRKAKTLPCGHIFCLSCLMKIFHEGPYNINRLKCPTCRMEIFIGEEEISNLTPAFHIDQMLDLVVSAETRNICSKHGGQELNFYCTKCSSPVCRDCTVADHKETDGHKITDLSQVLDKKSHESSEIKVTCEITLEKLKLRLKRLENAAAYQDKGEKYLVQKVDCKITEYINIMKQRQQQLKSGIARTVTDLRTKIEKQNDYIKEQVEHYQELYDDFCQSRNSKDVHKILTMNEEMIEQEEKFRILVNENDDELFKICDVYFEDEDLSSSLRSIGKIMIEECPDIQDDSIDSWSTTDETDSD